MVNPADSEYLSVVCIDFATNRDPEKPKRLAPVWAMDSPLSGANRAWSLEPCETWPVPPVREPGPVDPIQAGPVLILNTTGDPATPLAWAQSLHGQIKNSTLVVAPAQGHIASSQNACAEDTLTAFLMKGILPAGARLQLSAEQVGRQPSRRRTSRAGACSRKDASTSSPTSAQSTLAASKSRPSQPNGPR